MFSLSEEARVVMKDFFAANANAERCVRIFFTPAGGAGPVPSMVLDRTVEGDVTSVIDGVTYCMTGPLSAMVGMVSIDYNGTGFIIKTEHPYSAGPASSCGGHCSSCGGGCGV